MAFRLSSQVRCEQLVRQAVCDVERQAWRRASVAPASGCNDPFRVCTFACTEAYSVGHRIISWRTWIADLSFLAALLLIIAAVFCISPLEPRFPPVGYPTTHWPQHTFHRFQKHGATPCRQVHGNYRWCHWNRTCDRLRLPQERCQCCCQSSGRPKVLGAVPV